MKVRYLGKKTKDSFGEKLHRALDPVAEVTCKEEEFDLAIARVEYTGYRYDSFGDDFCFTINVYVSDHQDYEDFMALWKDAKRFIK